MKKKTENKKKAGCEASASTDRLTDPPFKPQGDGNMVEWEENGEIRQVQLFEGDGDIMLIFKRGDKETPLRLSQNAVGGLLALFLKMRQICS
ncbi:MAG: hypothetical protein FJ241_08985 [Nitrospira sp.]|nr:hypothetical protein [Nitrospira sp.]